MSEETVRTTPLDPGDPHGRGVAARPDRSTKRRLWFSLLAPAAAWTLAQLGPYTIVGRLCGPEGLTGELESWQWIVIFGVPAVAAAVALTSLLVAVGVFRRWTGAVAITRAEGWNRVEFMAIAGAIISLMLFLNIVYFGILPMIVDPCLRVT